MPTPRKSALDKLVKSAAYDVIAIGYETKKVSLIAESVDETEAGRVYQGAIVRKLGYSDSWFAKVPHGKYRDGGIWAGYQEERGKG